VIFGVDSFDKQILQAMQKNSKISTEDLGEAIGLSPSAVQRRIKKLKTNNVLLGEVAVVNADALPGYITVVVDVSLEKGGEKILDKFASRLTQAAEIQQLYYAAGDVDFVAIVICKNMEEFDKLSRTLFMSANVKKFTSKVVIQSMKVSTSIPL
jgi:DNA-binding Lrp family transcriptional regulator